MSTSLTLSTPASQTSTSQQQLLFTFTNMEIPESIKWGGEQKLAVHDLVGGARVIDAMGSVPVDLSWTGYFLDVSLTASAPMLSATERAQYLDNLRINGSPLTLGWAGFNYTVLIESFTADYNGFKIPYSITCKTVADNTKQVTMSPVVSPDQAIAADMSTANTLASQVNNATLTSQMTTLQTAVNSVSTFANATQLQANSVLIPLTQVQAQIATLQASACNTLSNITTLGGIAPYNPVAVLAQRLVNQTTSMSQSAALEQLNVTLGRISQNIIAQETGPTIITVAGGNLMQLAVKYYGDASEWTTIAQANNLTDPQLTSTPQQLYIPNTAYDTGGVLNA